MQCVHETDVDQRTRPDHGRRLDKKLSHGTCKSEAQALSGQGEQDVEAPAELARVKVVEFLEGNHSVEEVARAASEGCVGHRNDDDVLLDVERSRVEISFQSKEADFLAGKESSSRESHWIGDKKHDIGSNIDDRVT